MHGWRGAGGLRHRRREAEHGNVDPGADQLRPEARVGPHLGQVSPRLAPALRQHVHLPAPDPDRDAAIARRGVGTIEKGDQLLGVEAQQVECDVIGAGRGPSARSGLRRVAARQGNVAVQHRDAGAAQCRDVAPRGLAHADRRVEVAGELDRGRMIHQRARPRSCVPDVGNVVARERRRGGQVDASAGQIVGNGEHLALVQSRYIGSVCSG